MWVEELSIENIRCFQSQRIRFADSGTPYPWVTFLGENGGGKSTALQTLGLLLAGPEGAKSRCCAHRDGCDEANAGKIGVRIHQDDNDPGKHGTEKVKHAFTYSYNLTGSCSLTVNNKLFTEPSIVPAAAGRKTLSWLRQNAFASQNIGWFSVGYGAFRRLTRSTQIIVPSLESQARLRILRPNLTSRSRCRSSSDGWCTLIIAFPKTRIRSRKSRKNWGSPLSTEFCRKRQSSTASHPRGGLCFRLAIRRCQRSV